MGTEQFITNLITAAEDIQNNNELLIDLKVESTPFHKQQIRIMEDVWNTICDIVHSAGLQERLIQSAALTSNPGVLYDLKDELSAKVTAIGAELFDDDLISIKKSQKEILEILNNISQS